MCIDLIHICIICTRIDTRIDTRLCLEHMAGTFAVAPSAFELVGDPVLTAQHWLTLNVRPDDFDANSVWKYVQKVREIEVAPRHLTTMINHLQLGCPLRTILVPSYSIF